MSTKKIPCFVNIDLTGDVIWFTPSILFLVDESVFGRLHRPILLVSSSENGRLGSPLKSFALKASRLCKDFRSDEFRLTFPPRFQLKA